MTLFSEFSCSLERKRDANGRRVKNQTKNRPITKETNRQMPKYGANWQIAYSRLLCLSMCYVSTCNRVHIHIRRIFSALLHDIDILHTAPGIHRHTMYHTMKSRIRMYIVCRRVYICNMYLLQTHISYSLVTLASFVIHVYPYTSISIRTGLIFKESK